MKEIKAHRLLISIIFTATAALLCLGAWFCYTSSFDTATVGLMSVNILNGERPLFFYGQPYFGALEAYLGALYLYLFGFSEFALSLAPITFTLGWVFCSYLFFSRVQDREAGIIAAACTGFSGYYVFWYSIATYGGYSAIFFLGTAVLWLCLRIYQENPERIHLWMQLFCVGVLVSLSIWVHALTFPYIAVGALILAMHAMKQGFRFEVLVSLILTGIISLTGFIPFYVETGSFLGGISESVHLTKEVIVQAVNNLFLVNIQELIIWNFLSSFQSNAVVFFVKFGYLVPLLLAAAVAGIDLVYRFSSKTRRNVYILIPLFFCSLFLSLYVQHHMATVKAPRYAIGFWIMLLSVIWVGAITGPKPAVIKRLSLAFFSIWIVLQITGTVIFIKGNSPGARKEQLAMRRIVQKAEQLSLKSVVTYGDRIFGYKAQKLSMFAGNSIAFANADLERYQKNAQAAELDKTRGYLTDNQGRDRVAGILNDLGAGYKVTAIGEYTLFSSIERGRQPEMKAIPPSQLRLVKETAEVKRNTQNITKISADTVRNHQGHQFTFDAGENRKLCGVWMFTEQNPYTLDWNHPGQFEISVSTDGFNFTQVYRSNPISANGYHSGEQIYIGGPRGKAEAIFKETVSRYLRITLLTKSPHQISQIVLFEADSKLRKGAFEDIHQLMNIIDQYKLNFILADRYVSAHLLDRFAGSGEEEIALPRHSTKFKNTPFRYFIQPKKGTGVVCAKSVAAVCRQMLTEQFGDEVILKQIELQNYSVFALNNIDMRSNVEKRSALLWNGHLPDKTNNIKILAPWFNFIGMPFWGAKFVKTKNIYHDGWTDGEGRFVNLKYTIHEEYDSELIVYTNGWRPMSDISALGLEVFVNRDNKLSFSAKENNSFLFQLPENLKDINEITVRSSTFKPPGNDPRELGMDIERIELR